MTGAAMTVSYGAHHALIAALPAVVPAVVIAAVIAVIVSRDRRS